MKLSNLLKKELRELLTPQAIFAMFFTCILLVCIGQVMGTAMEKATSNTTIYIADADNTDFTSALNDYLAENDVTVEKVAITPEQAADIENSAADIMESADLDSLVIIPKGFTDTVNSSSPAEIICTGSIKASGLTAAMSEVATVSYTGYITKYVREHIERNTLGINEDSVSLLDEPLVTVDYTTANGKTIKASSEAIASSLMMQSMIAPLAVFFLLLMASQMIMTAISTEKIDKTLETLMSAPVSRITVLLAKMIAALVVALLNSASMMIGFAFYMKGMTGSLIDELMAELGSSDEVMSFQSAIQSLGLTLTPGQTVLFGISLFVTIAIGLAISLILGAMATDTKSVQTLTLPIMMLSMIPFFVTMFIDINSLPAGGRMLMYIIPFTHTYTAMSNMMFGHTNAFIGGFIYQIVFFAVCMYLAVRVFTTDLLFTMKFTIKTGNKKGSGDENASA